MVGGGWQYKKPNKFIYVLIFSIPMSIYLWNTYNVIMLVFEFLDALLIVTMELETLRKP